MKANGMDGPYSTYGEKRNAYRISVGKREEKRALVKPRLRPEDNSKIPLNAGMQTFSKNVGATLKSYAPDL